MNNSTNSFSESKPPTDGLLAIDYHAAGKLCDVHPETIARAVRRGELRASKIGRAVRIRPADLDDWLRRMAGPTTEGGAA